jgi:hypothetical protein
MHVMKHNLNWNVSCVQLIHNISNHAIHLNNMYSFRATQTIDSLRYKDHFFKNYLVLCLHYVKLKVAMCFHV